MSFVEPTNTTSQVSSTINNNNSTASDAAPENSTRSSENYDRNRGRGRGRSRGGRRHGGGRGGSFHEYRSHNFSNQELTPTNTPPQTNNTLNNDIQSQPIRNNSTPRRNRGRASYSPRNQQGSQSPLQSTNDNNDNSTDNNTSNTSESGNQGSESIGGGRGYSKKRFHNRHQYRNNNNNNTQDNANSSASSLQSESRDQENNDDGSSSRRHNKKFGHSRVANKNQTESQNLDSNQNDTASTTSSAQSIGRSNTKIDESDPKGKKSTVSKTEASSSLNQRNSRRSAKSSISKPSPEEIKDVLTSITHGLSTSTYECMICCENIRPNNKTWFCEVCWAVFHLNCTQKWAKKSSDSKSSEIWRCPGCQNNSDVIPEVYKCFCGKYYCVI
jgi:transcriptional repressor NF-X1